MSRGAVQRGRGRGGSAERRTRGEVAVPAHTRKKRGRRPLPDFLPVHEVLHDLSDDEKICPHDASHRLVEIGREQSDQLKFIPATVEIVRHIRPKYACSTCKQGVRIAPMPKLPVPKSIATPSLLAQVATSKYVDGLPLYRQEKIFQRLGLDLSRATLAHWMVKMGDLVEPLVERIRSEVRSGSFVQCDETPFQVLKEPGKRAQSQSYSVGAARRRARAPAPVLRVRPLAQRRGAEAAASGLRGLPPNGRLRGLRRDRTRARGGARRMLGARAEEVRRGAARPALEEARCEADDQAEQGATGAVPDPGALRDRAEPEGRFPDERHRERQVRSRPVIEKLREWLDASIGSVPPQSLTGKAMAYLDRQWPKLVRVLDDGRLPLDTNLVENAIRPFVVGRKAWLFADTVAGARASANLYSLIETAKANRIEPWRYLNHLFEVLPRIDTPRELEPLLPQNIDPDALRPR